MLIAVGVAFAISFVLYKDQAPQAAAEGTDGAQAAIPAAGEGDAAEETEAAVKEAKRGSPVNGKVVRPTEVNDEQLANEKLGG